MNIWLREEGGLLFVDYQYIIFTGCVIFEFKIKNIHL